MATRINLGASTDIRPGWINADIFAYPGIDTVCDLNERWPWPESSVDEFHAVDIFEHLQSRIFTMNQAWKCLKPGGILRMECPDAAKGAGQWQDCTHITPWTPNGIQYFQDGSPAWKRFHESYGISARFKVHSITERSYTEMAGSCKCEVWKFVAILEAVK